MTQDDKAQAYDNLVREGDRVNRKISAIKTNINRTPQQDAELAQLNIQLQLLEQKLKQLFEI
jgi:hypothetical protein